jgi:hypothetical protein
MYILIWPRYAGGLTERGCETAAVPSKTHFRKNPLCVCASYERNISIYEDIKCFWIFLSLMNHVITSGVSILLLFRHGRSQLYDHRGQRATIKVMCIKCVILQNFVPIFFFFRFFVHKWKVKQEVNGGVTLVVARPHSIH